MNGICRCPSRLLAIALLFVAGVGYAQKPPDNLPGGYPRQPIRIIVGNPPGGGTDTIARLVAAQLGVRWGRTALVENRAGGTGVIAMELVAKAPPDGYMLYLGGSQLVISTLLKRIPFNVRTVYVPIVQLTSQPYLLAINASLPVGSVRDLIAYAKRNPGTLSYGSSGNGSLAHLGMELFKAMAGVEMLHVPYKGNGPAMIDLMSGQIQLLFGTAVSVGPNVRSGKLKSLGVTSAQRTQAQPDVPTIAESGLPGYDLNNAYGLFAPIGLPQAIVLALNREANEIIRTAEFRARLAVDDVEAAAPNTPAGFKGAIDRDFAKWEKFFKTPGLKTDEFL